MSTPSFTSGRKAVKDPVVENLNVLVSSSPLRMHYIDDSLSVEGMLAEHVLEGEGVHLGADIRSSGVEKGVLNVQMDKATDTLPNVAHVIKLTKGTIIKYYGVTTAPRPMARNQVVRAGLALLQIINPFFSGLLSEDLGDTKQQTFSKASGDSTIDPVPINHRTGATKAYAATQEDGSALPSGLSINASTGVLSIVAATIATGTYTIKITASDLITTLPANHPWRTLEGEGTLILTVTA